MLNLRKFSPYLVIYSKKIVPNHCTEVRFASLLSGGFITAIVVNPPEMKLAKRTSVHCLCFCHFIQKQKSLITSLISRRFFLSLWIMLESYEWNYSSRLSSFCCFQKWKLVTLLLSHIDIFKSFVKCIKPIFFSWIILES